MFGGWKKDRARGGVGREDAGEPRSTSDSRPPAPPPSAAVPLDALPGGYFEAHERGGEVIVTRASEAFARMAPAPDGTPPEGRSMAGLFGRDGLATLTAVATDGAAPRDVQRDLDVEGEGPVAHATLAARVSERADGSRRWSGLLLDAGERRRDHERIYSLAYYDTLTALPNRRLFLRKLEAAAGGAPRRRRFGMLAFIDLDNFKALNDTRGHAAGDELLVQVARRLKRCVPDTATVGRLGGDEFVLLLEELGTQRDETWTRARGLGDLVLAALALPVPLAGGEHGVTGSIGLTLFEHGASAVEDLLREADLAMYEAKAAGKNEVRRYDARLAHGVREENALIAGLDRALAEDGLDVALQPQVNVEGRVVGAEMLVRWTHPERGPISPGIFVPLAERNGLVARLDEWAIRRGAAILAEWGADPRRADLELAVNVSADRFLCEDFPDAVARALPAPERRRMLTVEMTERVMTDDLGAVRAVMERLGALGVRLSLDDFGTGYSSFEKIDALPIGEVKIDGSFVRHIDTSPRHRALVRAILDMARALDMRAVAEGVERDTQLDVLLAEDCRQFQGYLFSRPVAPPIFDELVRLGVAGAPAGRAEARLRVVDGGRRA